MSNAKSPAPLSPQNDGGPNLDLSIDNSNGTDIARSLPPQSAQPPQLPERSAERSAECSDWGSLSRGRRWRRALAEFACASFAGLLSVAGVVYCYNLLHAEFYVPWIGHDMLWTEAAIKGLNENGWFVENPLLGAPGISQIQNFPAPDILIWLLLKLFGAICKDPALTINVYYVFSYYMVAVSAYAVMRLLDIRRGPAIVCATLFSSLPFHLYRYGHLGYANYFIIPLVVLVALWLCDGANFWNLKRASRLKDPSAKGFWAAVICILLGMNGPYFAFMGCILFLTAGAIGGFAVRKLAPCLNAILFSALTTAAFLACMFIATYPPAEKVPLPARNLADTEQFGLRISHLLLPHTHRLQRVIRVTSQYYVTQAYNEPSHIGTMASAGFLMLILTAVTGAFFSWPGFARIKALACLNLAVILYAHSGGFSVIFSLLVSPMIRSGNRFSIFIAFFSLFAAAWVMNQLLGLIKSNAGRVAAHGVLGLLLFCGMFDQTWHVFIPYADIKRDHDSDAALVEQIEKSVPENSQIFQLPYQGFPEAGGGNNMQLYDGFRGYLHSHKLHWTFGAFHNTKWDMWQRPVSGLAASDMFMCLAISNFSGVFIDTAGYADPKPLLAEFEAASGVKAMLSLNGRLAFFKVPANSLEKARAYFGQKTVDRGMANPQAYFFEDFLPEVPAELTSGDLRKFETPAGTEKPGLINFLSVNVNGIMVAAGWANLPGVERHNLCTAFSTPDASGAEIPFAFARPYQGRLDLNDPALRYSGWSITTAKPPPGQPITVWTLSLNPMKAYKVGTVTAEQLKPAN